MLIKLFVLGLSATLCLAGTPKIIGKVRPCMLNDYACIGNNLAANSNCNIKTKPVASQYWLKSHRFETPFFNASYIDRDLIISGLDKCFVSEFYLNVNKDTGVLGIDCPGLTFESDRLVLQHNRLQEDGVYNYKYKGTYGLTTLTANFKNADVMNFCNEYIFAYVAEQPTFCIDPKDQSTKNFLSRDLSMLNIFERETFLYRASLLARLFVNSRLCDFGCV